MTQPTMAPPGGGLPSPPPGGPPPGGPPPPPPAASPPPAPMAGVGASPVPTNTELRPASRLGRAFAVIGGMRSDLVDEYPTERRDFIQMAFILFTTALEAFFAAAFAIEMAFSTPADKGPSLPLWGLFVAGLVWALVIFNIDRFMVMGMEGLHGRQILLPAAFRVVLAGLIGFVMATPLVLQVFSSEIDEQIIVMNAGKMDAAQARIDMLRTRLATTEGQLSEAVAALSTAGIGAGVDSDPAVISARTRLEKVQGECFGAKSDLALEKDGLLPSSRGGSERPGPGPKTDQLREKVDTLCDPDKVIGPAEKSVSDAVQAVTPSASDIAAATKAAQNKVDQLTAAVAQQTEAWEDARTAKAALQGAESSGLLTRLEALEQLTSDDTTSSAGTTPTGSPSASPSSTPTTSPTSTSSPTTSSTATPADAAVALSTARRGALASGAHKGLVFLLMAVEILPVLFKALKQWKNEPSAYECRWRDVDNAVLARSRAIDKNELAVVELNAYQPVAHTVAMHEQQDALNAHMIREITGVQRTLMEQALRDWATSHGVPYTPGPYAPPQPTPTGPSTASGDSTAHDPGAPDDDDLDDDPQQAAPSPPTAGGAAPTQPVPPHGAGAGWQSVPPSGPASTNGASPTNNQPVNAGNEDDGW